MMNYLLQKVRKYPLSLVCVALVWYLSFFTPPHTKLELVPLIDKWTHLVMYGGTCSMIWLEYWRAHTKAHWRRLFVGAWLMPVIMSGVIEILQEYCTNGRRDGDWMDFLANTVGVTLGALLGVTILAKFRAKR